MFEGISRDVAILTRSTAMNRVLENLLQHSRNRIFLSNINELTKQTVLHLPLAYLHTQQWWCIMPTPCKQLNQ